MKEVTAGPTLKANTDTQNKLFWQKVLELLLQLLALQANSHQVPPAADFRETAPSDVCGETVISANFKKGNGGPSVFNYIFIA